MSGNNYDPKRESFLLVALTVLILLLAVLIILPAPSDHRSVIDVLVQAVTVDNPLHRLFMWLMCWPGSTVCPS